MILVLFLLFLLFCVRYHVRIDYIQQIAIFSIITITTLILEIVQLLGFDLHAARPLRANASPSVLYSLPPLPSKRARPNRPAVYWFTLRCESECECKQYTEYSIVTSDSIYLTLQHCSRTRSAILLHCVARASVYVYEYVTRSRRGNRGFSIAQRRGIAEEIAVLRGVYLCWRWCWCWCSRGRRNSYRIVCMRLLLRSRVPFLLRYVSFWRHVWLCTRTRSLTLSLTYSTQLSVTFAFALSLSGHLFCLPAERNWNRINQC